MIELENRFAFPSAPTIACRERIGTRGAVLWIHGYTLDSGIWDEIWSHLPGWTHYGIDLPGHGTSPALPPGIRLRDLGQIIARGACDLGVRHIVGLSLGSLFALEAVLHQPATFSTLTLAAPVMGGGPVDAYVGLRYRELSALFHKRGRGPWMTELWMRSPPATFAHATPDLAARLQATIDRHSWSELSDARFGIGGLAREPQAAAALGFSPTRLMVLIGEHEFEVFRDTAATLRAIRPDAVYAELEGAGHLSILHAPGPSATLLAQHWQAG